MTTFHSNQRHSFGIPPPVSAVRIAERHYVHQVCANCNTALGCSIAESMELPTEHGVLIGTGWCNRCQSVQPVLRQRYVPPAKMSYDVELLGRSGPCE